jgi:polyvinyl alcohol dehydrogenase (cytochrome)
MIKTTAHIALVILLVCSMNTALSQPAADDQTHPGYALYQKHCAICHANPEILRAHAFETLRMMSAETLNESLTEGMMASQGAGLSVEERSQVIAYLAADDGMDAWVAGMMCPSAGRTVNLNQAASMTRYGIDGNNSRNLSAKAAGLKKSDMSKLELAWAVAFPNTSQMRAAPVIVGDTIFYSAIHARKVFALDTATGCAKWVYDSPNRLRASITLGPLGENGPMAIVFGDGRGFVQAVDATSGKGIWIKDGRTSNGRGSVSGSIVLHKDKIIVPISDSGVGAAARPSHECCVGHGAVTALDAATGERLWEYHTMEEATYTGEKNALGAKLRGPSGAPIWSTPTVDEKRGLVYVTTGENTSLPATITSDAIIALDLETGDEKWVFQALARDVWNMACTRRGPNCPAAKDSALKDFDFGGPAIIATLDDGTDILLAGQKSGDAWGVNPDTGAVIWNERIGEGSALGGNHWGIAATKDRLFMPINDPVSRGADAMPGMYAFEVATGKPAWAYSLQPDCDDGRGDMVSRCEQRYGMSAAPLVVDGAVIGASVDGRLLIFDGDNGSVLFQYDTATDFITANEVPGSGGAIDAHAIAAGSGMVFIGSGYGFFGQTPGNVLLAFKPGGSD